MSAYPIVEDAVVGLAILFSAERALRYLLPSAHRALRGWLAARLGLTVDSEQTAPSCDSGCNTCGTGCSTPASPSAAKEKPGQPLQFVRRSPPARR